MAEIVYEKMQKHRKENASPKNFAPFDHTHNRHIFFFFCTLTSWSTNTTIWWYGCVCIVLKRHN